MGRYLIILIGIICSVFISDIALLFQVNFFLLIGYLIINIIKERYIRLYHIWVLGYIYIVIPEGVNDALILEGYGAFGVSASQFISIGNWIVLICHNLFQKKSISGLQEKYTLVYKKGIYTYPLIIILLLLYVLIIGPISINSFLHGRVNIEGNDTNLPVFVASFIKACGFILPALIAYYYKFLNRTRNYLIHSFLLSLPIFALLFIAGTRFPLLFSMGGFILMHFAGENISFSRILKVLPFLFILVFLTSKMKEFRTFGVGESGSSEVVEYVKNDKEENGFFNFGSNEGVVISNAKLIDYFETHDHMFGLSNAFIFYFWIPRSLWQDKPQMLGYWFIRQYDDENHDSGHNVSFAFIGDAYADFGFAGGLIFCSLLGFALAYFDNWVLRKLNNIDQVPAVLATLSYSYIFFFVRSPQTSTFNFLGILVVYFLVKKTLIIYIKKTDNEASICDEHSGSVSK